MSFVIYACLLLSSINAAVLHVPSEYSTIQDGIDFSQDGDTVLVENGRYYETIDFSGKAILLTSNFLFTGDEVYIDSTIIDASLTAGTIHNSVVTFLNGENSNSRLIGFTITGGTATFIDNPVDQVSDYYGGGILCIGSSPIISDLYVRDNHSPRTGGGVYLLQASPVLERLTITDNTAGWGAGISMHSSEPSLLWSVVADNVAQQNSGGIDVAYNSVAYLDHLTVTRNHVLGAGLSGGLALYENSTAHVMNSIIYENSPEEVDFVSFGTPNTASFHYNLIPGGEAGIAEYGQSLTWGEGNIEGDPLFCDVWVDDFHLATGSPCIGAGESNSSVGAHPQGCDAQGVSDSTVGHWSLAETTDESILDSSENGIDGFKEGGIWTEGINGTALWLNSSDHFWIPYHPYLMVEETMTIEVICQLDIMDTEQVIVSRSPSDGFILMINEDNHLVGVVSTSLGPVSIEAPNFDFMAHTWYHIAFTVTPSLALLYIDHSMQGGFPISGPITYDAGVGMCVGGMMTDWDGLILTEGFQGTVDEVRLSNVALTPTDFLPLNTSSLEDRVIPEKEYVIWNYPNPFNPSTTIQYGLPEKSDVSLVIYDVRGQVVTTFESEDRSAGWYEVTWNGETIDGGSIPTGVYFARISADEHSEVIKMLYLK